MNISCRTVLLSLVMLMFSHAVSTFHVQIHAPEELKKYLVETKTEDNAIRCSLIEYFSSVDVEPFITALAVMPSDVDGNMARSMLWLLYNWALSAGNECFNIIESCIEKIKDPDAHEELWYWHRKCMDLLDTVNLNNNSATTLDLSLPKDLNVPKPLRKFIEPTWVLSSKFPLKKIPEFITVLASLPPTTYVAHTSCIKLALESLCKGLLQRIYGTKSESYVEHAQFTPFIAIKKQISMINNPLIKQEITYWFNKSFSLLLFEDKNLSRKVWSWLLENGAYLKSRDLFGRTLFCSTFLDDELYARLEKSGLKPTGYSRTQLWHAMNGGIETAFEMLLRYGGTQMIHKHGVLGGNIYVELALAQGKNHMLRKLLQRGIDINNNVENDETLFAWYLRNAMNMESFFVLLGQQPKSLPILDTNELERFEWLKWRPYKDYLNFMDIATNKQLDKFLDPDHLPARIYPLILLGKTRQFKQATEHLSKHFQQDKEFQNSVAKVLDIPVKEIHGVKAALLIHFCTKALEYSAKNFVTLLSLCAQNQLVDIKPTKSGYTITLNARVINNKELKDRFAKSVKEYLSYYEPKLIRGACAPIDVQQNLYKIVTMDEIKYGRPKDLPAIKKVLKKIQDVKFAFHPD